MLSVVAIVALVAGACGSDAADTTSDGTDAETTQPSTATGADTATGSGYSVVATGQRACYDAEGEDDDLSGRG